MRTVRVLLTMTLALAASSGETSESDDRVCEQARIFVDLARGASNDLETAMLRDVAVAADEADDDSLAEGGRAFVRLFATGRDDESVAQRDSDAIVDFARECSDRGVRIEPLLKIANGE